MKWQPAASYHVLATAYDDHALYDEKASDARNKQPMSGPGINEPMLWTTQYGNGRVFITALGHDGSSVAQSTFKATFTRGAEWAATGKVTLPVPADWKDMLAESGFKESDIPKDWKGYWDFWCDKVQVGYRQKNRHPRFWHWPATGCGLQRFFLLVPHFHGRLQREAGQRLRQAPGG